MIRFQVKFEPMDQFVVMPAEPPSLLSIIVISALSIIGAVLPLLVAMRLARRIKSAWAYVIGLIAAIAVVVLFEIGFALLEKSDPVLLIHAMEAILKLMPPFDNILTETDQ